MGAGTKGGKCEGRGKNVRGFRDQNDPMAQPGLFMENWTFPKTQGRKRAPQKMWSRGQGEWCGTGPKGNKKERTLQPSNHTVDGKCGPCRGKKK